jgi:predicted nucleotidyltransferase
MLNSDDIVKQAINSIVEHTPDIAGIYIFGSMGTAFENQNSDLDLAILPISPITSVQLWTLSQQIAASINKDVDLINLLEASTVFRFQVISTGRRVYCHDQKICDEFEMTTYSMYLRFNEERKEILDAIKNRGQILNG